MHSQPPAVAVVAVTPPLMNDLLARILAGMDVEVVRHPDCLDEQGRECRASLLVTSDGIPPGVEVEVVVRVTGEEGAMSLTVEDAAGDGVTVLEGRTLEDVVVAVRSHLGALPREARSAG